MSSLPRVKASPALLPRPLVSLGALVAIAWAALGYRSGAAPARLGGALGAEAIGARNLPALAAVLLVLPVVINGTFYLELALGPARGWVDPRLTARWEGTVYACAALLALGWLRLVHADLGLGTALPLGLALATATVGSLSVMRRAVRADELQLVQGLSQAIAADINLAHSFARIQELTRRLVPWEQMGFARYDARTNEMALIADTALPTGESSGRFDADTGLTGEAVRLGRPVGARGPRGEPAAGVPPGRPRRPRGGESRQRRRQGVRRAEAARRRSRGGGGTDTPGRSPDGADHGAGSPGDPRRGAAADRPRRDDPGERE